MISPSFDLFLLMLFFCGLPCSKPLHPLNFFIWSQFGKEFNSLPHVKGKAVFVLSQGFTRIRLVLCSEAERCLQASL